MPKVTKYPPVYTGLVELLEWTLPRTASIPKSSRFTFGQRIDNLTIDALMLAVRAIYAGPAMKAGPLSDPNLALEQLRVLWRLVQGQAWISQRQLLHVNALIDDIGRMTGGWLRHLASRT